MTKIAELGEGFKNLPKILEIYNKELEQAETNLKIKGKLLETSVSENSAWMHYYDQRKIELGSLVKFFKQEEDRIRGKLYRGYIENHSRTLGERTINKYIDFEEKYLEIHSLLIEVEELFELYQSVVNTFQTRNYALSSIAKLRVAQLEYTEI